jgi:CMP-N-acetylneuraminic acid synthetase
MGAHSERVPEKNRQDLGGQPLYTWVLGWLQGVPEIDEIVVNTDDPGIAAAVQDRGLRAIERPEGLRGGHVDMNRIIEHDLGLVEADVFLQTHATNPFLTIHTICQATRAFLDEVNCTPAGEPAHDSLLSVTRQRKRFWWDNGDSVVSSPVNHDPYELKRTQDLPGLLEENSCLYIFTRQSFARTKSRIGLRPMLFEIPAAEAVDIDTAPDLAMARARWEARG